MAKQGVCNIVQHSYAHRDDERSTERICELEQSGASGDRHAARILRRLEKAQQDIKQLFQKLKRVRVVSGHKQGVVRVEIPLHSDDEPKSRTRWTQVDIPREVV